MHKSAVINTYEMRGKSALLILRLFLQETCWRLEEA